MMKLDLGLGDTYRISVDKNGHFHSVPITARACCNSARNVSQNAQSKCGIVSDDIRRYWSGIYMIIPYLKQYPLLHYGITTATADRYHNYLPH